MPQPTGAETLPTNHKFFSLDFLRAIAICNLLFAVSIAILTACYFLCYDQASFNASIFGFPLIAIGYGLLVASAISPTGFLFKLKSPRIIRIATFSYSIYLTHKIVIHLTQEQLSKLNISKEGNLMFLLCIITSVLIAFLMNRVIEKPFSKLRDRFLSGNKGKVRS